MFNTLKKSLLYLFLYVFHVSISEQLLLNDIDSADRASLEDHSFLRPVIVDIELDKYGQDDVYVYRNLPVNISRDSSEDLRKSCASGHCGPPLLQKRPPSKDYPTMMHCRGLLAYCRKECLELNFKMCSVWPFLCPKPVIDDLPDRCRIQCIHNYRQMRLKFPALPKLPRYTNPRYDRFDYY